ncbi:MAG TPA: hypothetical protein DCQ06_02760, partial [Myxococcales bacterium]|nr:hypothetical protein [Myxococcales bacterium]
IVYGTDKCAEGEGCLRVASGTSDGYCTAKGMVAPGNFCLGDELCVTLFCEADITKNNEPRCGTPCDPGGATCTAGQQCNPISDKVGVGYAPAANTPDEDVTGADAVASSDVGSLVLKPVAVGDGDSSSGCNANHRATNSSAPWILLVALSLVWVRRRQSLVQP